MKGVNTYEITPSKQLDSHIRHRKEHFAMLPSMLICILCFCMILKYKLRTIENKEKQQTDELIRLERKASLPIKRDMSDLIFLSIPITNLPFKKDIPEKVASYQNTIKELSSEKICNLSGLSNMDLKLKYGAGNLNELMEYDQNYTLLIRTLADWGTWLYENQFTNDALIVLEYAKDCNSDIRKTYATLAKIYKSQEQYDKIYDLIHFVEPLCKTIDLKKAIYDVINDYEA